MSTQEWLEDQELVGLAAINTIVKKLISRWMSGLHVVQLDLVSAILVGQDILLCTATGDGNLTAFSVPSLVLLEYIRYPEAYPAGLPTRTSLLVS